MLLAWCLFSSWYAITQQKNTQFSFCSSIDAATNESGRKYSWFVLISFSVSTLFIDWLRAVYAVQRVHAQCTTYSVPYLISFRSFFSFRLDSGSAKLHTSYRLPHFLFRSFFDSGNSICFLLLFCHISALRQTRKKVPVHLKPSERLFPIFFTIASCVFFMCCLHLSVE